uniref:N-acetyltransferase domain-containing protein n=1 Tax=Rhabditophanes sp. KR3021 TaxID=114890 RepID=A0AC35UE28_9BILA
MSIQSFDGLPTVSVNFKNFDKELFDQFHALLLKHDNFAYDDEYFNNFCTAFGEDGLSFITAVEEKTKIPMGFIIGTYWKNSSNAKVLLTIGNFYIMPEYRGKGLGSFLFNHLIKEAVDQKVSLYLTANPKMTETYSTKYNFSLFREYKAEILKAKWSDFGNIPKISLPSYTVCESSKFTQWKKFEQFDLKLSNGVVNRLEYFKTLFKASIYSGIATNNNGEVVGCVSMRCANKVVAIGPLYAENKDLLQLLLNVALEHIDASQHDFIRLNTFTCNRDLKELLSLYTGGKFNIIWTCNLQFAGSIIPSNDKYLHSADDLAQNFM